MNPPCHKQILSIVRECDYRIVSRLAHCCALDRAPLCSSTRICRISANTCVYPADTSFVPFLLWAWVDSGLTNARWRTRHIQRASECFSCTLYLTACRQGLFFWVGHRLWNGTRLVSTGYTRVLALTLQICALHPVRTSTSTRMEVLSSARQCTNCESIL